MASKICDDKNDAINFTLGKLIEWCKGTSTMPLAARKEKVKTVWNDSRKVGAGDVFVALRGEADDGHKYLKSAFDKGAVAAIVDKKGIKVIDKKYHKKCIIVSDTQKAIQRAAAIYREEMAMLVIGITGSNGKTTTRTFIAEVLKRAIKVGETYTNWNNHLGVAQSILKFDGDEWAGVLEMGANHVGEISTLTKICKPDIAIITNIGYAHVGLFGSLEDTTQAKFEIAEGLHKKGFMLLNGDDSRLVRGAKERNLRTVFYGTSPRCDIRAKNINVTEKGVAFTIDDFEYALSLPGRHFIYCALPAIYIAMRCGISREVIKKVLMSLKPAPMRGTIERKKNVKFIVDCYNANPSSMSSAIKYLCDVTPNAKNRVAVVGDMYELEKYTKSLHLKLGKELVSADVQKIIAVGKFAKFIEAGAVKAGMSKRKIFVADNANDAIAICRSVIKKGETVLLKGSRGVGLEKVFEGF